MLMYMKKVAVAGDVHHETNLRELKARRSVIPTVGPVTPCAFFYSAFGKSVCTSQVLSL